MDAITKYDWPGNVRQLENTCYWLALMTPTQNVKVEDLPEEIKDHEVAEVPSSSWEEGFNNWVTNVATSIDKDLLDIVNPKIEKIIVKAALAKAALTIIFSIFGFTISSKSLSIDVATFVTQLLKPSSQEEDGTSATS